MGFSFEVSGSRSKVTKGLDDLDYESDLHEDDMGDEIRELISSYLSEGGEPGPGLQYVIKVSGHAGRHGEGHTIWLNARVSVEPLNAAGPQVTEEGKATDNLKIG